MHLVIANLCAFHGFKSTSTYVQRHLIAFNTFGINRLQYAFRKVESCSRSSHRALNFGIYGLIGLHIALLRLTIQVGRNGQFAHCLKYLGKGNR